MHAALPRAPLPGLRACAPGLQLRNGHPHLSCGCRGQTCRPGVVPRGATRTPTGPKLPHPALRVDRQGRRGVLKAAGTGAGGNPHLGARGQLHLPRWAHFPAPCTRPPGLARPRARSARSLPWTSALSTDGGTARLRARCETSHGLAPRTRTRVSPPEFLALRPERERAKGARDRHWPASLAARASPHRAGPRWSRPLGFARETQAGTARASELPVPGLLEPCSASLRVLKA